MGRVHLLAGVICATVITASPGHRAEAAPALAPAAATWTWSWQHAWGRVTEAAGETIAVLAVAPARVEAYAVELQVRWRDAAQQVDTLIARFLPGPGPDLRPLVASPVPGVESSGFGWRRDPIQRRRTKFHKGTDYRADRGTPVYAAGAGVVAFTGRQRGYGKVIYIDHGGGLVTRYAHLNRIEVEEGTPIGAATRIGQVGSTGRATGPHLHFEVRLDGRAVDPVLAMRVAELSRTDPMAARLAAQALAPEAQVTSVDRHDPPRRTRVAGQTKGQRPARTGAPARSRALW